MTALCDPVAVGLLSDDELGHRFDALQKRCGKHAAERAEWERCARELIQREADRVGFTPTDLALLLKGRR